MELTTRPLSIAIFGADPGWHSRRLMRALAAWPNVDVRSIDPAGCAIDLTLEHGLSLPGCADRLPDGVFVRGIPAGSFEQVTLRLSVLHALARIGVTVYNPATVIERTVDKAMTSFLLHRAGIATPPVIASDDPLQLQAWRERADVRGFDVVLKPLFGAEGDGLLRLAPTSPLPPAATGGLWYLQRFVEGAHRTSDAATACSDIRVFVIRHRARFAMRRINRTGWITNVAQGAEVEPVTLSPEQLALAEAASRALQTDYAGVDLITDLDGRTWVLEVNSVPAWRGLQSIVSEDIATAIVADFIERCRRNATCDTREAAVIDGDR